MRTSWLIIIFSILCLCACSTKKKVIQETHSFDLSQSVDMWDFDTTFFFSSTPFDSVPTLTIGVRHRHLANQKKLAQRDSSHSIQITEKKTRFFPNISSSRVYSDCVLPSVVFFLTIVCIAVAVRWLFSSRGK